MGKDFGAELFGAPDKGRDFGADLFGAPAKPEDVGILSGTGAAFKRGLESFGDVGQGYGIAGLKLFGSDEEVAKKMAEAKAEQAKTVEKPAISFADLERIYKEKGLGAALSNVPKYIAESTAESAPQMAVPLAVGAAAGAVSGPFAPVVAPVAGIATYGLQQFGNLMTRQGQEAKTPEDINVGKAAIASAIQAPIGYFVDRFTLGLGGMGEKGVIEVGKELAKRKAAGEIGTLGVASGVAKQAGKGAAQGFIAEAPTEVLEQSLERWQAGLPLADADAYREYKEAFFGAGGVGLTGGAISRGATAYKGTKTPQEITQEEAPLTTTSAPQGQLLLPRPDEILLNEKEYDPLKNPVGNFTWQELTKEQRAYINKDRKENGKPLLNTYSLEDVVDAIRHTENTPEAQEGAINTLLAYKTNYDQINNEQLNADLLFKKAELHNVDTGTQGWNDYLMRVTGTDDIASMTQPQLYSAFKALDQLEVNPAERIILPEGTNAVRFNEKQYADALKGIEFDFGEYGTDSLSRTSVIDTIKEYTNLTRTKDAEALYNQAIKRGDLEENLVERNTSEGKKFVPEVSFAGKSEALPGGFDIRDQAFKHGTEPEAYEIRNGAAFLKRVNDPNTAQQEVEKLTKINEGLVKESQKKIDKLTKTIEYRNAQLDLKRATGFANTLGFKKLEAHIDDLNKTDQKSIAVHENDIKNLTNPLQIVPVGEKPVVKRKQVFYKEGKPTASFEKKEEAEAYGILNLDDATLEQIVASAPTTKGTLPKRYAAMAKKELERRRTDQKGIEVKRSFYTDEAKEKADELAKTLIPALKRFGLENVGLRIVNSIRNGTADGEWAQQVITIAMDSKNPMGTLRHESIHALKELGAFTDAEWKVLENKAKGEWVQRFIKDVGLYDKYKEEYKRVNKDSLEGFDAYINEEAIAEAFKYFENFQPPAGMVGNIFYRISQMMEAIRNAFNGVGLNTPISIFNKIETGGMQIDASLLNYDPLVYKGEIDDKGNRYALLQHASRVDFENISEKNLNAFAFGYGAYTSVTPAIGKTKLSNADVTEASKHYGKPFGFLKDSKGYVYVADIPLNRENTLFLSESPESQPVIAEKMVKAGIIEEDKNYGGYKTTKEYGNKKVYSMSNVIDLMGETYANDMIQSGYPLTGLMQEKRPTAQIFNDEYGIKKRVANELSDLGIDISLTSAMNDIYAIVHKPEKFNDSLVGKYEMDSKGKLKAISGLGVESESFLEKVKEALRLFPKKQTEFKIKPEDLPELGENVRFSLRQNEPRKIGDRIVGAPPNAPTEADRKKLVSRMVKLLEHPYSMYERSKDWYERSGATIKEIARDDPVLMEQIVRLTALYSQANSLGGNITAVIKSIAQIANGNQKVLAGRFPETTAKVIPDILAAKTMDTSLKGVDDKLMNFYRNLHDATFETDTFQDSSTIDRWMMRLFGYPHTEDQELGGASAVSATQYKYAKDLIERITEAQAKKTGEQLHPRQIQSALWTYIRNMSNYDDAVDKAKAKAIEENKKFNKNAVEFTPDILDFSDYVKRATAHITWETRPSESLPMIQGIHTAPREQQDAFNRAVQAIFTDPSGEDKVFKLLNNQQLYTSQFSIGAYENKIAPNIITKVVLQKDESGHLIDVAREYSAIIGYVTRQDAVPWYRPDPTASGKLASKGYKVSLDVPITQELEESLFKHINDSLPGIGFTKVDESFDFINYRGDDGKPYMMSDKKYIDALQNALQTFSSDVHFNIDEFRAQSEYFSNNWKEQTNGEGHLSRISPERLPNIQSTLDNWRNQYDTIAKRFGEEYGWDKETKFSFRSFKPVEPTFRPSEDSGRGITLGNKQENSITVDGVHYGNVKTDELDASKFGTGLRGAERRRLEDTDDERIKKRVYFYIPKPNGEMPTRESGVGSNVYTQTFDNILGQGKEMSRLYSSAMDNMNNFESSIVDAGYDGYAILEMGMMVILNHNVPVNYEGTIAELSEIGRLEKGRVLPKPVLPENLQNEVKELRGLVSNITLAKIERALADYTEVVVNAKITPEQRTIAEKALAPYYEKAKAIKPLFEEKLKKVAESVGGVLRIGGIKKVGRAAEKLTLETKNGLLGKPDGKDIMDLLRATIVVPTVDQVPVAIENIGAEFKNVQRIKDRFKNPTPNGYRDVLMNVKLPNQLFAEVQINIPEMIVAKHTGHKIYKMSRSLDEGTAKHEQLVNTERALYDEAYLFAQKAKSESSALEPLLRNASLGKGTEVSRAQTNEPSFSLNTGSASTANNVAPSGTLNGTLNIDNSSTEKNKRFSLALGSVEPSTFLVSDANPNNTGDLAFIPPNSKVPSKPIRLAVGTHSGLNDKGFGANHIIDRIRKDASRRPPAISKELLEDIILNVENVGKSFSRIYQEINPIYGGTTYILYDPKTRDSLIVRPRADYYEVITAYKQDVGSKYGNPVWSGANVQPEQPVGFFAKQQGISVKSGERGVETQAVATVVKKRRILSPEALQQMADDRAGKFSLRGEALPSDIDKGDNLTFLLQDKQIDLKRVIENIRKQGKDIADKWNAYLQEELFHGRSAARVKYYIDRELQPLLRKMDSSNITLEQMDDYLLARHAKEANAYIRTINNDPKANSGMTDQQADDFMNNMTVPRRQAFERIAKDIDVMTKQTRQMMVDYGLETQKTINTWEKTYKNYVPLFREETEGGAISTGRGYNIRGSTTRARIGSSRGVVDILANIALQRERTIARGEKNRVGNALLGLILQNPDKNFWSAIRPDEMSKSDLESELLAMGLSPDVARNLADKPKERVLNTVTGNYEFKTNPLWLQQSNIFITRVNGEDRVMIFNKDNERSSRMAVVFNNLDANQKAEAIKMMGTAGEYFDKTVSGVGTATRYFAAINTQYNPAFSIFNFLRDVGGATLNLQSTPLKGKEMEVIGNSLTALKSIYRDLRLVREGKQANSKWAQIFEEFELEGGKTGFRDIFNTSEERANALAAELNAFKQGGARTKAKAVFDWLSDFNEAVENSIRVSAYKSAIDMGMSKQQAASLAKNLTVNFNRTGAVSKNFTTLYAFFNASVQGTARIAETLMKDGKLSDVGKKIVYGGIGVGVLQSVLLAMAGFDEDEPPEFVKDKNFVIPYGDKKYISIPMPLGFNMFPAFGRRATEFAMSDNKNVGKAVFDMSTMIMDAFNPLGSATFAQTLTPTLLDPIVALSENKDFSGKPISKDDLNSLNPTPGYTRAKENASAVSTGLAYGINFLTGGTDFKKGAISPTPDQIDYLIGQVTGGVGREILKTEKLFGSTISGEELATNNVPVIGRMLGDVKQKTVETSRFYDNVKTMNEHQHEIEGRIKSGQNIDEYLNEHPEAGLYKYVDKTYNKVNQMKRSRKLLKEQNVPDSDLKSYDEAILVLMTSLNDAIREAKVSR